MVDPAVVAPRRRRLPAVSRGARGAMLADLSLAVVLAAASFAPQLADSGLRLGQLATRSSGAWAVVLTLGQCLPLLARRRWPETCLVVVAGCYAAYQTLGYHANLASVGLLVALYSMGAHGARFRRTLAAVATAGYVVLAVALHHLRSPERPLDYVTFFVLLAACWGAGSWVRGRQAAEAGRARESARLAIAHERASIARELHDVVTHHVTAMVVQADSAQLIVSTEPQHAAESLAAISGAGRRSLADLRVLLDVLDHPGGGPEPGSAHAVPGEDLLPTPGRLDELVERTRLTGQPVELTVDGEPASAATGPALAVYRVVQEALTNAVKHAPGRHTVVRVRYGEDIRVDVSTDGPVVAAGGFREGRGLTGLRERVRTYGGEVTAGGRPGGGFSVHARVPSGADA